MYGRQDSVRNLHEVNGKERRQDRDHEECQKSIVDCKSKIPMSEKTKKPRRSVGLRKEKFEMEYRLLKYTCTEYCQGSADKGEEYALIKCPSNASFNNVRSTLIKERHIVGVHEIDINSVKDLTIKW